MSIETRDYAELARIGASTPLVDQVKRSLNGCKLFIGVDRLDYSKGIMHRLESFGHFLGSDPEARGKVSLLQITPKSREEIPEYETMVRTVNELVGDVNGTYGEADWTPIRYVNRPYSRPELAGLFRMSAGALVTPLRDGMNLVAKEYVAAQDPQDPGVLILSQFAGAAAELEEALIVNPHETEGMAAAMKHALEMPLDQRQARHAAMFDRISRNDIQHWADTFLARLTDTRRSFLIGQLRSLFG